MTTFNKSETSEAIFYDNGTSGLTSDNLKDAVDELKSLITGGGGGTVSGPASSTDNAITRWNGITGMSVQDSLTTLQDGGGIQSQGFMTKRSITDVIQISSGYAWIAAAIELELSGSIEIEPNGLIIVV